MQGVVRGVAIGLIGLAFGTLSLGLLGASSRAYAPDKPLVSERLGAWLPTYLNGFDPWRSHNATIQGPSHYDQFVYHGRLVGRYFGAREPSDGTFVEYGNAGPPKARITYDYARGIAFYTGGCCSFSDKVLAVAARPPQRVTDANLAGVRTQRGIALGDPASQVRKINGFAILRPVPHRSDLRMLSYAALEGGRNPTCGQFQNFIFRRDRLIYLELLDGC